MIKYTKYEDIPLELKMEIVEKLQELQEYYNLETFEEENEGDFGLFLEYTRDSSTCKESKDSSYIYNTYTYETKSYKIIIEGSEYLKDHCICDEKLEQEIIVIDKKEEQLEKEKIAQIKKTENTLKWIGLFENTTKEELFEILKDKKFPA